MRICEIITENITSDMLSGIDLTNVNTFITSLNRAPKDQVRALNDVLLKKRQEIAAPYATWTKLYHGTTEPITKEIMTNGFQLTKGQRSVGSLGATIMVDNQGIFLTDSIKLAHFFGGNRADYKPHQVITTLVDTSRVLDSDEASMKLRKLGLSLVNRYKGTTKTRLAIRDWWWLVDNSDFVAAIKAEGYSGVRFKEDAVVRRDANAFDGHTYCIFDVSKIKIEKQIGMTVNQFYEWLKTAV